MNKKIVGYEIIYSQWKTDLVNLINERIKRSWVPVGGVSLSIGNGRAEYCQAMVRYEDENDNEIF